MNIYVINNTDFKNGTFLTEIKKVYQMLKSKDKSFKYLMIETNKLITPINQNFIDGNNYLIFLNQTGYQYLMINFVM